jgi:UDP-N-acetylmuramoyl-tripeptide--D-alanyl-D-alanine ligase
MFSALDVTKWSKGEIQGDDSLTFNSVSTDTRTLSKDSLFIALKGDTFDAQLFIEKAFECGATGCVISKEFTISEEGKKIIEHLNLKNICLLVVDDTLKALQDIASGYRSTLHIPIIGITGSNGKTSTKNYIAAVLSKKYKVAYTKGNLNNHIGLPLSILSIKPDDQIAVLEMGMNHKGEILELARIAQQTYAVITNIGLAHIEFFESRDGIANEKAEIARTLPEDGILFLLKEDDYFKYLFDSTSARKIVVTQDSIDDIEKLKAVGIIAKHMISNALLALSVGREFGVLKEDMFDALHTLKNEKGRFNIKTIQTEKGEMDIIDDTYNANPDSVCAALQAMYDLYPKNKKVFVLGCLKEQGTFLNSGYQKICEQAVRSEVNTLIMVDIDFKPVGCDNLNIVHVMNHKECKEEVLTFYDINTVFLFKGSRGSTMEKVIELISTK